MTTLAAEALTFAYDRDRVIFRDLSLELRRGEVLVLLGANGAGKTTLLRTLAGQLNADAGVVRLDDQPIGTWSRRDVAQRLTLMPQSELRESPLSVRDMVALGRAAHRGWWMPLDDADHQIVDDALRATDLVALADRPVTQLSGGQWRLAILARSLAQNASILLLDEPTSGLDLKHQYDCLNQVRQIVTRRGLIAVLSLHDLQQTAMFADRVALLVDQKIVALGDCHQVLTAAQISAAYGIDVTVIPHPTNGRPLIVPLGPGSEGDQ